MRTVGPVLCGYWMQWRMHIAIAGMNGQSAEQIWSFSTNRAARPRRSAVEINLMWFATMMEIISDYDPQQAVSGGSKIPRRRFWNWFCLSSRTIPTCAP